MGPWEQEITTALDAALGGATPPELARAIRYSILSPGKRFRPRLMEASATMLGVAEPRFIPFGVALEWIHGFTLIHDDLPCMDDDDFRRGVPTCHKVFGEAMALLAGDALIPAALEWTLRSLDAGTPPERWRAAFSILASRSGPAGVIGGQAAELAMQEGSLAELRQVHALKTGALFDAAILIPAALSGIEPGSRDHGLLSDFSSAFGLAFQAADDLEDLTVDGRAVETPATHPATSILKYLPVETVRSEPLERLGSTLAALRSRWGTGAAALVSITEALDEKIRSAGTAGGANG